MFVFFEIQDGNVKGKEQKRNFPLRVYIPKQTTLSRFYIDAQK